MKLLSIIRNSRRALRGGAVVSLLMLPAAGLQAQPPAHVQLPAAARGAAAIQALGAHLPDVAKAYGLDTRRLSTLLQQQPSLGVDRKGALFVVCAAPGSSEALPPDSSVTKIASGTAVDAFALHSFPGASRVIYLDFTGHTTTGTHWNTNYGTIVTPPFDTDGNPSSFSSAERAVIQSVWQRVAEDFAPFAIDVTTQDPGIEALKRTDSSDNAYGIRVVIGPNTWYSNAGGVAYIASFRWNTDTPCFVFSNALSNHPKYIAEAAAHEAGHTVGLYHDGATGTEYYSGHGNWAPLMGVGYYKPITQFSSGEYAGATNREDDFAIITAHAPLATDDHANVASDAATPITGTTVATGGTIETRADVDVFRFDIGTGNIALNVTSPAPEANLHIRAEILSSSGQVLYSNPASSLTASLAPYLPAGRYYLRVSGIGAGDPNTTGYSDYGSVGNYLVTGSLVANTGPKAPVAVASVSATSGTAPLAVTFSSAGSGDSDGSIVSYHWNFGNGVTSSEAHPSYTYTAAGNFTATLTVTDTDGLQASASVTVNVTAPVTNERPIAAASATPRMGQAPLPVSFSSQDSRDPDGSIVSYAWEFGDGAQGEGAAPTHTYTSPGTYTARLTVTDNEGAQATSTLTVTVQSAPVAQREVDVAEYALSPESAPRGTWAVARIVVRDASMNPVSGAKVTFSWAGLASGSASATTNGSGEVTFTSKHSKAKGTITGTITAVVPASEVFNGALHGAPMTRSLPIN